MRTKSELKQYTLTADTDIAGMIWRSGSIVHARFGAKNDEEYYDLFLTHKKEYAKRGSHAPVIRLPAEMVEISEDEIAILSEPEVKCVAVAVQAEAATE